MVPAIDLENSSLGSCPHAREQLAEFVGVDVAQHHDVCMRLAPGVASTASVVAALAPR